MIGIYKITNPAGKVYVGKSKDIEKRFKQHKFKSTNKFLRQSILYYGIENHVFEVIEECSIDELIEKERFYIKIFADKGITLNENTLNHVQYKRNIPAEWVEHMDKALERCKSESKKHVESEKQSKTN